MNRRLGLLATFTASLVGLSGLAASPAAAAGCNVLGVVSTCQPSPQPSSQPSSPPPSSSPQPQPSSSPQPSQQPSQQPAAAPSKGIAEAPEGATRLLQLVNQDRAAAGAPALEFRGQIASIATGHSRDMAGRRTIWHNDGYFTAGTRRALNARGLGENVALNGSVDDAHRRLMASPGHRANILNGAFDAVGISVVHDESGTFYVTQNFVDSNEAAQAAPAKAKSSKVAKAKSSKVSKAKSRKMTGGKARKAARPASRKASARR